MSKGDGRIELMGRILLAAIFILSGCMKIMNWDQTAGYMGSQGLPLVPLLLVLAIGVELFGGLSVLLGYRTRVSGALLFLYLIPVTLIFHAFWSAPADQVQMQTINFLKNVTIMGGLLGLVANGAGRMSLDARFSSRYPIQVRPPSNIKIAA